MQQLWAAAVVRRNVCVCCNVCVFVVVSFTTWVCLCLTTCVCLCPSCALLCVLLPSPRARPHYRVLYAPLVQCYTHSRIAGLLQCQTPIHIAGLLQCQTPSSALTHACACALACACARARVYDVWRVLFWVAAAASDAAGPVGLDRDVRGGGPWSKSKGEAVGMGAGGGRSEENSDVSSLLFGSSANLRERHKLLPGALPGALVRGQGGGARVEGGGDDAGNDKAQDYVQYGDFRAGVDDGAHRCVRVRHTEERMLRRESRLCLCVCAPHAKCMRAPRPTDPVPRGQLWPTGSVGRGAQGQ